MKISQTLAAIGGITLVAGVVGAPDRIWPNLLLAGYGLLGLGLAGIFFVALQYASGAGWSVALRRVPEAMSAALPIGAAGLALTFIARPSLYPWTHETMHGFKHMWLSLPFFLARSAFYVLVWAAFAIAIVRSSRRQDEDGELKHTYRNRRLSAAFLVVFAVTFWLASYDWIMSLEPEWASTIFGVYNFAGLFLSGLAAIILLALRLHTAGPLRGYLTEDQLHDLGKLLFAFSTFWMYIWFSQYMLIWYANIPEETAYYIPRLNGFWGPLFVLNMLLNWAVPFIVLLPRRTKRNPATLARIAVVVLLGRWLDLYLMIIPPSAGATPVFGVWEIGIALGAIGVFALTFQRAMRQAQPVPLRDPLLVESLHYHQ